MAKLLVASESIDSESKETTPVRNPATGELVDSVPKGTVADIRRAIDVAANALKKWSIMAPSKRGSILLQAGHLILQQEKEPSWPGFAQTFGGLRRYRAVELPSITHGQ